MNNPKLNEVLDAVKIRLPRAGNFFAAAIIALVVAGSSWREARADITTGLVGYWSLSDGPGNSNVMDFSGNGNTGTLVNFADTTYNNMWTNNTDPTNGWPYAMLFNQTGEGTNTYITIPDSTTLDSPSVNKAWTLAAWVNVLNNTSQANGSGIVAKGTFANTEYAYCIFLQTNRFAGGLRNAANNGGFTVADSNAVVSPNTWYHVAVTVQEPKGSQNSEMTLYVNGVVVAGTNGNTYTTVYTNNSPVTIGCFSPATLPFEGIIDEVRIYNRELSQSDVTQLYNNKAFALQNNGIGSWNGLAGSGGNAALDTTSLNYCTNAYTAPAGTAASLSTVLNLETANSQTIGATFSDVYYSSSGKVAVASTNLTTAVGGVAFATASAPGSATFLNTTKTYILNSSDGIGIMDGPGGNKTSLVESGSGAVILTGTNTFSGGVTINNGTVQVGNGGAISGQELGTATTVTDNGTLIFDGNNNLTFNSSISGTGSLTQKGTGTLALTAANSYTNGTTITNSTVNVNSFNDGGGSLGTGAVNLQGATILYTGTGDSTSRQFNGTPGTTNTIDVPGGITLELTGRVTGTAAWFVNKVDTGILKLSGAADNSFLGMNVNAGTVILNKGGGTGHAIGNPLNVASGATVQLAGSGYTAEIYSNAAAPVTINSGGVLDTDGQTDGFYSLSLAGTGSGSGALINSASSSTSTLYVPITLAANTTIGGPGNINLPNPVSGSGSLTYSGTGELMLEATNTYTGGTVITSGTLDGSAATSIPGNVSVSSGAVFEMDNAAAIFPAATLTLTGTPSNGMVNLNYSGTQNIGALIINGSAMAAGTYGASASNPGGVFTGSGLLNVVQAYWDGNGTDASHGTNTFGGGSGSWDNSTSDWWVAGNTDTTWSQNNLAYFAGTAGTVTLNANVTADGMFFSTAGYVVTNTDGVSQMTLAGNDPIISIPAGTTAVGCTLTGGGSTTGLTVSGPGTLIITGTNTYSNGTLVESNATLDAEFISDTGPSSISTSGNLMLNGGALAYTGASAATTSRQVSSIGTNNTIDVAGSTSLTLSGSVLGTGTSVINKTDTGTLYLGGTTDNSSLIMNINAGEVIITKTTTSTVHGLGGGSSTVAGGAELQLAGSGSYDLYSGCILTVASGGILDLNSQSDTMSTLTISGTGAGSGALINSTTSATSSLTNGGSGLVLAGATTVGGPGNITLASTVSGSGATLTYAGTGMLTLSGANTYTGGTIINAGGTVSLNNSASGAGTGTITDNGTLDVGIVGNNATLNNAITGPGVVNLIETSGDNLQLGGSMSGFTGTLNCPASASSAKCQILTSNVAISSSATINLAAGGTLYLANAGVTIPCPLYIGGLGNSEAYGALRLETAAVVSGPVILLGNTTMGGGGGNRGTISGPIIQSNGTFGIEFTAQSGSIVLTGTNTFTGGISISNTSPGMLIISGSGTLGAGNYAANITNSSVFNYNSSSPQTLGGVISGAGILAQSGPGTLTLTQTNTYSGSTVITNGATLTIGGAGSLGAAGTSNSYAGSITNFGTLNYASSAAQFLSGVISGTGAVTETGPGELTLSGADSYTGATTIGTGATLAVASTGSISDTASVNIAGGATLDVSAYGLSYNLSGATTLQGSGTGTNAGTAATIKGGSGATITVDGPVVLNFTPTAFSGDTNHPSLYVSQGALTLGGSGFTVTNLAATPLGLGSYALLEVAGGNLTVASTNITVKGTGLAANTGPTLALTNGILYMDVVATSAPSHPGISSFSVSGGNLIFSGTNGPANGNYVVLMTTNVALPRSSWTPIATNTFSGTGTFSVTNAISGKEGFYSIEVP